MCKKFGVVHEKNAVGVATCSRGLAQVRLDLLPFLS